MEADPVPHTVGDTLEVTLGDWVEDCDTVNELLTDVVDVELGQDVED